MSMTSCEVDGEHLYFTKHTVGFAAGATGMGAAMAVVGTHCFIPKCLVAPKYVMSLLTNVDYNGM